MQWIKTPSTEEHPISKLTNSAAEGSELYQHWQLKILEVKLQLMNRPN